MSSDLTSFLPASTTLPSPATVVSSFVSITATHDGSGPPFPPMTTPWSTPRSCTWTYDVDAVFGPVAWLDLEPRVDATTLSCYPDGMFFDDRTGVFSPGTCPSGWTTVSTTSDPGSATDEVTTTAVCCSSEYTLDGDRCLREVPTILAVPISYNKSGTNYDIMTGQTSTLTSATLAVHTIRALYQSKDKEILGLLYKENEDISDTRGMSTNIRIGLGIGMAALGLIILCVAAWLIFRRPSCDKSLKTRPRQDLPDVMTSASQEDSFDNRPGDEVYVSYVVEGSLRRSSSTHKGEEDIEVLRAQKDAIQRRIEELERSDANEEQEK